MAQLYCLILLTLSLLPSITAICYFPDGTIPRQDTPCRSSGFSTCCGAGYACLSNNLCMLTEHVPSPGEGQSLYVRGSCTDQSWNSEFCPNFCITPSNDDNSSGGQGVKKCRIARDRYYCINNQTEPLETSEICSHSANFFEFAGTPSTLTIIGVQTTTLESITTSESRSAVSTSSTMSTSAALLSAEETSSPSTPATTATPSASSPQSPASPPSLLSAPDPPKAEKDYSVAIGAGVGIPLGIIAISIAIFLFFRHRRNQRAQKQNVNELYRNTVGLQQSFQEPKLDTQYYNNQAHWRGYAQELPADGHMSELK